MSCTKGDSCNRLGSSRTLSPRSPGETAGGWYNVAVHDKSKNLADNALRSAAAPDQPSTAEILAIFR